LCHREACTGVGGRETIEIDHPAGEEIGCDWFERRRAPWWATVYVLLGTLSHSWRTRGCRGVLAPAMDQAHRKLVRKYPFEWSSALVARDQGAGLTTPLGPQARGFAGAQAGGASVTSWARARS